MAVYKQDRWLFPAFFLVLMFMVHSIMCTNNSNFGDVAPFCPGKKNVVIAFDLHGVLLNVSMKGVLKTFWKTPKKVALAKLLLSSSFRKQYKATKKLALSVEQRINLLVPTFPLLQQFRKPFRDICNQQDINHDMLLYVKKLKAEGYHLIIASNIGEETYKELEAKYPILKELFEYAFTSGKISGYTKKSSPVYFDRLKQFVSKTYNTRHIIFIDDHATPIKTACAKHIYGIQYSDSVQVAKEVDRIVSLMCKKTK